MASQSDCIHKTRVKNDTFCIIRHFTGDEQQGSISIYGNEVHVTTDEVDTGQPVAAGSNRVCAIIQRFSATEYFPLWTSPPAKYTCFFLAYVPRSNYPFFVFFNSLGENCPSCEF
jgi:hypothetical protein